MAYSINRKIKRVYAPGFFSNKKVNPWQTNTLTRKQKKLFSFGKKKFSNELRQVFRQKSLLLQTFKNSLHANMQKNKYKAFSISISICMTCIMKSVLKQKNINFCKNCYSVNCHLAFTESVGIFMAKKSQMRPFLASSFWAFSHPMAVPGTVKVRRAKSLYNTGRKAVHNLNLWFGGIGVSTLVSLYKEVCDMVLLYNNKNYSLLFETLWPNFLVKIGGAKNPLHAKKSIMYNYVSVFPAKNKNIWQNVLHSTFFTLQKPFWHKNLSSFYKGCSKKAQS